MKPPAETQGEPVPSGASFVQAVRLVERRVSQARQASAGTDRSPPFEVGTRERRVDECVELRASERMHIATGDLADIAQVRDSDAALADGGKAVIHANILGLCGATPTLPLFYSELLLREHREQKHAIADFLNVFDHRALSFFYRIHRRRDRALAYETGGSGGRDAVTELLLSLAGIGGQGFDERLPVPNEAIAPAAGHFATHRRTAAALESVLARFLGHPVTVREFEPQWIAVPLAQQTRIGGTAKRQHAVLGAAGGGEDAAMVGAALLDVQHNFAVEIGPLSHSELVDFVKDDDRIGAVSEICRLFAGTAFRIGLRLRIDSREIPAELALQEDAPPILGKTSWLGRPRGDPIILDDCKISLTIGRT